MGTVLLALMLTFSWGYEDLPHYYGDYNLERTETLKKDLFDILNKHHRLQEDAPDLILDKCPDSFCYKQRRLSYKTARKKLFGQLHLSEPSAGIYALTSSYCQVNHNSDEMTHLGLGPNKIPKNKYLNTEHSWPQSKFTKAFPKALQKSDIHILFPIISRVNSIRGNRPFGKVITSTTAVCDKAFYGKSAEGRSVFEPADEFKGNVARALFYYSVRYKVKIDEVQESYLRQWHHMDPVDASESIRNEDIYVIQDNRNPFIDIPELVDRIENF